MMKKLFILLALLFAFEAFAKDADTLSVEQDAVVQRLIEEGFVNVRANETSGYKLYSIECDSYKLPVDGVRAARRILEESSNGDNIKLVLTHLNIPELTMTYNSANDTWRSTKSLDESWHLLQSSHKYNSSFGKINILVYPQLSIKNLIINQVYQALWQLNPTIEMSLLPGMKLTYQLKLPIYNDGYSSTEGKIHPGMVSLSQSFRLPTKLSLAGRVTLGAFTNNRYGIAVEGIHYMPDERFSLEAQVGYLGAFYWSGFKFKYAPIKDFVYGGGVRFFQPSIQTLFSLKAIKFLEGDKGLKYEMVRYFHHSAVGLYAEKSRGASLNVGFRFQIALPPYRQKRHGYLPRVSTAGQMGMTYVANNDQYYYKEFRCEASDNIMSAGAYNPFYIDYQLSE